MFKIVENQNFLNTKATQVSLRYDKDSLDFESITSLPTNLEQATKNRKIEFFAGRVCAETAFERLSGKKIRIASSPDRSPVWPSGFVGSISHCEGFATAVVAAKSAVNGIGVDAEILISPSQVSLLSDMFILPEELNLIQSDHWSNSKFATLIFSAKESIFKCFYPHIKSYFDFKDAVISNIDEDKNTFTFNFLKDLNLTFCKGFQSSGKFFFHDNFVHTLVEYSETNGQQQIRSLN